MQFNNLFTHRKIGIIFNSCKRFPITIILSILSTLLNISLVTQEIDNEIFTRLAPILFIGIIFSLAIHLSLEHSFKKYSLVITAFTSILFILINYYIFNINENFSYYLKNAQLFAGISLFLTFAPFLNSKDNNSFNNYNQIIIKRLCISIFYSAVIFLGTFLAVKLISYLFEFRSHFTSDAHKYLFFISFNLIQVFLFLSGIPKKVDLHHKVMNITFSLKTITYNILVPLTLLYIFIMYIYTGKIIFTWTLPKGYVGWTLSCLNLLGLICILILHAKKRDEKPKWVHFFEKYYFILNIPLLGVLFVGVLTRINTYGMTESRYLLLIGCLWVTFISIYFILTQSKQLKIIPTSLSVLLLFTIFGPWSAYNVSLNSQLRIFKEIAGQSGFLVERQLHKPEMNLTSDERNKIRSVLAYIIDYHGMESLRGTINDEQLELALKDKKNRAYYFIKKYGLSEEKSK
ncbi:DUF4153 domain-containing protein [Fluviispira vulneris]|uniref:DUF4153 domain-containing protein n=1 Tax=Fluviispira vulneris TaxID=2763012 RepID=UPI001644340A|nr:DUF4153 domain-containing protein [Fluviispira vulneris]